MAVMTSSRMRFWGLLAASVVLLVLGLVAGVLWYRQQGFAQLDQAQAERQAAGRMATLADLMDTMPAVDIALQERWDSWITAINASWSDPKYDTAAWDQWIVGEGAAPQTLIDYLDRRRPDMDNGRLLIRNPHLCISAGGFLVIDLPRHGCDVEMVSRLRMTQLMSVREMAEWLRYSAGLADDPEPYLADLDHLVQRHLPTPTLIDALVMVAVAHIRDLAHVEASVRNRLGTECLQAWVAASLPYIPSVATGLRGEALIFMPAYAQSARNELFYASQLDPFAEASTLGTLTAWLNGPHTCAARYDYLLAEADMLDGMLSASSSVSVGTGRLLLPHASHWFLESVMTAWDMEAQHRILRAFALIRDPLFGSIPDDHAAAVAHPALAGLLQPGTGLHLVYERLKPTRFRIGISPTSPLPPGFDAMRLKAFAMTFATLPEKRRYRYYRRSAEGDVAPPPAPQ